MANLKDKAMLIKGKQYILVKDRVLAFNELFPDGMIQTELISFENKTYIVKAKVWPDAAKDNFFFTGLSQAVMGTSGVNMTAALENAETSAVGRALGFMGIGVIDSVASADEMKKAGVPVITASDRSPDPEVDNQSLNDLMG